MPKKLRIVVIGNLLIIMLDIILGIGLICGDYASRHYLTCVTKYVLYVWFNIGMYLVKTFHTDIDKGAYFEILKSYYNIPYNVDKYFEDFPDTFTIIGLLIIIGYIMKIYKH